MPRSRSRSRSIKFEITAPEFDTKKIKSRKQLKRYFWKITKKITKYLNVNGIRIRALKWGNDVSSAEALLFVPFIHKEEKFDLLFKSNNLYTAGVRKGEECTLFYHDGGDEDGQQKDERGLESHCKANQCLEIHGFTKINTVSIKDSYTSLQRIANIKRSNIKLGREGLNKALDYFSENRWDNLEDLARNLLFITQFFCEPLRIQEFAKFVYKNFLSNGGKGKTTPLKFLIMQHGWSSVSECLFREMYGKERSYVYFADNEPPLEINQLWRSYGILVNFEKKLDVLNMAPIMKQNMTSLYLYSIPEYSKFGSYYKSSLPTVLTEERKGKDIQIHVVKHIFEDDVVFHFICSNKKCGRVRDDLCLTIVEDSKEGTPITNHIPPLVFSSERHMFLAAKKPLGVKPKNFLISLSDKDHSFTCKLNDLQIIPTDHIQKVDISMDSIVEWQKTWVELKNFELAETYNLGQFSAYKSLSHIINDVTSLLHMNHYEHPYQGTGPHEYLLCGLYNDRINVLVNVSITESTSKFVMKLAYRCLNRNMREFLQGMVSKRMLLHSDQYSEVCLFSVDEDFEEGQLLTSNF